MNRLEAMTVFVTAMEDGSLSAAGRRLNMPLPTVSRKLSDLEAHLGVRLLIRSPRKLTLTEAGRDYLAACRDILDRVSEAELVATGSYAKARGQLVVAAPVVFGRLHVVPTIADFVAQFSDVDVRLVLGDRYVNLVEENVDVAIRIGDLPDSSLVATTLGTITKVVCASPAYLAQHGTPTVPADLGQHRCVKFENVRSSSEWLFPGPRGTASVSVRSRLTVNSADAALAACAAGVGITRVLSYQAAEAFRQGTLVRLLADHEPEAMPVRLVHVGQGRLPMKSRAFLDFVAPRLREVLRALSSVAGASTG
jgi:DNA-binding transcriptional LysR family regulator